MKKLLLLVGIIFAVGATQGGSSSSNVWVDSLIMKNELKQFVLKTLLDPNSAQFGPIFVKDGYICGYVNAKNLFGAYTGMKGFIATKERVVSEGNALFVRTWNTKCATKEGH